MKKQQNPDLKEKTSTARKDLTILVGLAGIAFVLSITFNVFERFALWRLESEGFLIHVVDEAGTF